MHGSVKGMSKNKGSVIVKNQESVCKNLRSVKDKNQRVSSYK